MLLAGLIWLVLLTLTWRNALVGIIILNILGFLPIIGWLIGFVFFLAALGGVSRIGYERLTSQKYQT